MDKQFDAICREAALAAEHIGIGVSALHHANYAEHANYAQAFFALSIGFERSAKLALVIDHALDNAGAFPSHRVLRNLGHNLGELLDRADAIAERRGISDPNGRLPRTQVHGEIVSVLSDFASNFTRYYNLDFLTGAPNAAGEDAVSQWHKRVTAKVIALHYSDRARERDEFNARMLDSFLSSHTMVIHTAEDGAPISSIETAVVHGSSVEAAKPFVRMYVLQIARFISILMSSLSHASYGAQLQSIPYLSDFYRLFNNDDRYFRQRKRWSIYRL